MSVAYCEYPCGCIAKSALAGSWSLVHVCENHKQPPPLEKLLRGPVTLDIEACHSSVYCRAINAQSQFAADAYAQAVGSMRAMALNPNLKGDAQ